MKKDKTKDICFTFFKKEKEVLEGDKVKVTYVCQCKTRRIAIQGSGYSNLFSHITQFHPDYQEIMKSKGTNIQHSFINKKAANIFKWLEWIVMDNLPFKTQIWKISLMKL